MKTSKIRYKVAVGHNKASLIFTSTVVEDYKIQPIADELQEGCEEHGLLSEIYRASSLRFETAFNADRLYEQIQNIVCVEYNRWGKRCNATKRKTTEFIRGISLDNEILASFILQTFININSEAFDKKTLSEKEEFFEPLESLRRVYGKRQA